LIIDVDGEGATFTSVPDHLSVPFPILEDQDQHKKFICELMSREDVAQLPKSLYYS
jgi:hypothetical protein